MPDQIRPRPIRTVDRVLRGIAGSVWVAATPEQRRSSLQLLHDGADSELVTENLVDRLSIKDQQLRVNVDENDPNPLSVLHKP